MSRTQCDKVYDYIKEHGEITQREAFDLGIYRLASRICDMKKAGINIVTESRKVVCADGTKTYIAVYKLGGEK